MYQIHRLNAADDKYHPAEMFEKLADAMNAVHGLSLDVDVRIAILDYDSSFMFWV